MAAGTRVGPYEILGLIGGGGMGDVYRARDTRLARNVAVKVLTEALAADPHFRERFEREARAIAALNHPHICTLYDVGEEAGTTYIVMELLDGETLAARLEKGALPLDSALTFASQIASALDAAHRAGIVHRDLKPGNVILTRVGAKLLDFGLAKTAAPAIAGSGVSMLPTTPPGLTERGTILGTFQYMAPEQLEGNEADPRTDIFAFGAVVYEMLTGRKAFDGKSQATLIGAIMNVDPPPVSTLQPLSPPGLDRVVRKCLAKEPEDRWQSAHDLHDEILWISETRSLASIATMPERRVSRTGWIGGVIATLAAAVAIALGVWAYARGPALDTRTVRASILPPEHSTLTNAPSQRFALSPDGSRLAFTAAGPDGRSLLWMRPIAGLTAQPLEGTAGAAAPFWSPDARFLGFFADSKLKKIDVSGGTPITLCDALIQPVAGGDMRLAGGTWNRDDRKWHSPKGT